uniref:Uncharacterized protein n=1 Tax=Trichobilharzia regenti TaxID=157069 RepID=A0AA85J2I1_TRIRE|nr:unnamed protein product [Trichobilharzia regenti]
MYYAQHDESVNHGSSSSDNENFKMPIYEPRCFDGNPTDDPQFIKEFEIMLSGFLLNDGMKLMYLMRYCTGVASRAIQCFKVMKRNEGYYEALSIMHQRVGRPSTIVRNVFEAVKGNGSQLLHGTH